MDNFLDRIAQKLNSQDVIKPSTATEESEVKRMKARILEYEKLLSEMRQVNMHNAELSVKMKATFDRLSALAEELKLPSQQSPPSLEASDILTDELRAEIIEVIIKNGALALEKSTERLIEMSGEMSMWLQQSQQRIEETVTRIQQSGEFAENVTARIGGQLARFDNALESSENANNRIADITNQLALLTSRDLNDQEKLLMVLEHINDQTRATAERDNDNSDIIANIKGLLDGQTTVINELSSKIEDFVHKENVKVYRNVQAVVEESMKQHGETSDNGFTSVKQDVKSQKLYLVLAIIFSIGSCAVSVLNAVNVF